MTSSERKIAPFDWLEAVEREVGEISMRATLRGDGPEPETETDRDLAAAIALVRRLVTEVRLMRKTQLSVAVFPKPTACFSNIAGPLVAVPPPPPDAPPNFQGIR